MTEGVPDRKKADPVKRFVAAVIDLVAAILLGMIPFIGPLLACAFWLTRDGLDLPFMDRRSPGKKLAGTRPVRLDGAAMDVGASFRRNWMLVLGFFLWPLLLIPVLGWLLVLPVGFAQVVLVVVEAVFVVTDADGRRWGDRLAGTIVVESPS